MVAQKIISRARKLLSLAMSPNPHEAELAMEEARAFLTKHGLTEADVAEEETRVLVERCEPLRRELARAVGSLRGLVVLVNAEGTVALRGRPAALDEAAAFYQALLKKADNCWPDIRVKGSPDPVVDAWRACAWLGFVDAVVERCIEIKKARPAPPPDRPRPVNRSRPADEPAPEVEPEPRMGDAAVREVEESLGVDEPVAPSDPQWGRSRRGPKRVVVDAPGASPLAGVAARLERVRYNVNIDWLYREAVALGRATGMAADIAEVSKDDDSRSLPAAGGREA